MKNTVYLNKELQNDNVYGDVQIVKTEELLGMPVSQKMAQTIISNGRGVHTCSPSYGLLPNKEFFGKMEHELIEQNIGYKTRSFNLDESRFFVDYILDDESKVITIKDAKTGVDDTIVPMIRLTNSYDGTLKKAGYLGFFRKVCNNGMHMTHTQIEFSIKATKGNMGNFVPKIDDIVKRFLENEMYGIKDKIDTMKVHFIDEKQIFQWIEDLATQEKVFRFDISDDVDTNKIDRAVDAIYNNLSLPFIYEEPLFDIGDSVEVPDPIDSDIHNHSFVGTVIGFRDEFVIVEDGESNCFDIEENRLTLAD